MKIAIYGGTEVNPTAIEVSLQVGKVLKKYDYTIITGCATGVSEIVSKATDKAVNIIGYSPQNNKNDIITTINDNYLNHVFYCTPHLKNLISLLDLQENDETSFKFRNLMSAMATDIAIAISGGMGTFTEIVNCVSLGKKVFLMRGTGGCTDIASYLFDSMNIDRTLYQDIFSIKELDLALSLLNTIKKKLQDDN